MNESKHWLNVGGVKYTRHPINHVANALPNAKFQLIHAHKEQKDRLV